MISKLRFVNGALSFLLCVVVWNFQFSALYPSRKDVSGGIAIVNQSLFAISAPNNLLRSANVTRKLPASTHVTRKLPFDTDLHLESRPTQVHRNSESKSPQSLPKTRLDSDNCAERTNSSVNLSTSVDMDCFSDGLFARPSNSQDSAAPDLMKSAQSPTFTASVFFELIPCSRTR